MGLLVVIGLIVVLRLIFSTNYFDVKEIRVTGVEETETSKLEQIAQNYKGKNIYRVDLDELEREISEISIYIKNVYAKKHLPNRIEISIKERYPSYTILNYDGVYLIDEEYIVTNIPIMQEIEFSEAEMNAYRKNDIESKTIKERLFLKLKNNELDVEIENVLDEGVEIEEEEEIQLEDIDFEKIPEKEKIEELEKLKTDINAIIAEHFSSLEAQVNESEFAGLRRLYFNKNGNYEEGERAEEDRLKAYDQVYEYFADDEGLAILKVVWTSDYTLQISFADDKKILFGTNRGIDQQLQDLEIVLDELQMQGKDFRRIDLRTETIGVK
ncbi:FtsQ-type POTRA domain-containing protein [Candidatus Dojkabacteria bacterium]|nr:FtsQ-type POTRA domain-containing protein [Candidatus Dojkabacteria bacterium]